MIASKKSVELLENAQIGILRELADLKSSHNRRLLTLEGQHANKIRELEDKVYNLSSRLANMEMLCTMSAIAKIEALEYALNEISCRLAQLEQGVQ